MLTRYLFVASSVIILTRGIKLYKSTFKNKPSSLQLDQSSVLKVTDFEKGISVCGRFIFERFRPPQILFKAQPVKWADRENQNWFLAIWNGHSGTFMEFGNFNRLMKEGENYDIWSPNTWHSLCLSFDRLSSNISIVKDGRLMNIDNHVPNIRTQGLDNSFTKDFIPMDWSTSGFVSDVHLWDFGLPAHGMVDWTQCR